MRRWLLSAIAVSCAASLLGNGNLASEELEYAVKAAYLLNFAKFVEWPPEVLSDPKIPINLCILGRDPFGAAIDKLVLGETIDGHPLAVRRISGLPASPPCQIVFQEGTGQDITKNLSILPRGALTVAERREFLREGGIIAFVVENRRVRFDVNQAAAQKAGLKLSSRLLNVARTVDNAKGPGAE